MTACARTHAGLRYRAGTCAVLPPLGAPKLAALWCGFRLRLGAPWRRPGNNSGGAPRHNGFVCHSYHKGSDRCKGKPLASARGCQGVEARYSAPRRLSTPFGGRRARRCASPAGPMRPWAVAVYTIGWGGALARGGGACGPCDARAPSTRCSAARWFAARGRRRRRRRRRPRRRPRRRQAAPAAVGPPAVGPPVGPPARALRRRRSWRPGAARRGTSGRVGKCLATLA